jgi:3D (Asp-Asp-Asp) domain-containing protein
MKRLILVLMAGIVAGPSTFASEQSIFARITVYWPAGGGVQRASSNGARLRNGHCAVDPSKIPYGSKVIFPDAACVAVDTGPAVIKRVAARKGAKTSAQRNALVIDRYFETKAEALAWSDSHSHYMTLQILNPQRKALTAELKPLEAAQASPASPQQSIGERLPQPAQSSAFAPPDVRGGIFSAFIGTVLPRS